MQSGSIFVIEDGILFLDYVKMGSFYKDEMNFDYPDNFARFYDVIYHQQRDDVDNDYFQRKIRQTTGKILEIGVGILITYNNSAFTFYGDK